MFFDKSETLNKPFILGSSNGRTAAFGAVSGGSNPPLRTKKFLI